MAQVIECQLIPTSESCFRSKRRKTLRASSIDRSMSMPSLAWSMISCDVQMMLSVSSVFMVCLWLELKLAQGIEGAKDCRDNAGNRADC